MDKGKSRKQVVLPAIGDEDEEEDPAITTAATSAKEGPAASTSFNGHKYFGIKSYLHKFYENATCNASDLEDFEDDSSPGNCEESDVLHRERVLKRNNCRKSRCSCLLGTVIIGLLSLFVGLGLLIVGFTFPRMKIDIGYQEEMRIIDKSAVAFNEHLEQVKVIGLVAFAVGGTLVASAMLLPALLKSDNEADDYGGEEHFKVRVHDDERQFFFAGGEEDSDASLRRSLIPVEETLKVVQPKAEMAHTVTTKAGLKQID